MLRFGFRVWCFIGDLISPAWVLDHQKFAVCCSPDSSKSVLISMLAVYICGLEFWSHKHWGFRVRQKRKLSVKFSSVAQMTILFQAPRDRASDESAFKYRETGAWSTESTYRGRVEPPQSRDLQNSLHWEILREVRQKLNRPEDDQTGLDQQVNVLIWG